MFNSAISSIKSHLKNLPGWRTDRKIVVIESDDWGSIRMSSKKALENLIDKEYPVENCSYSLNDALETNTDLESLMAVLDSVKDSVGNPAIFTINNIVGNPNFEKIKASNFKEYFYEPFVESLKRRPNSDCVMDLYHQGIKEKLFKPQFHGREHVHTDNWLGALRNGDQKLREVFDQGMFTYYRGNGSKCKYEYLDAFAAYNHEQFSSLESKIKTGLNLFENIWGYRSKTLIAPCYIWNRNIESLFKKYGILLIQSGGYQKEPVYNQEQYKIVRRYTGQKNELGQVYSARNVMFEPASDPNKDWVDSAMSEISTAFFWKKPAIISAHRVNFMGSINPKNRDKNIKRLKKLLDKIIENWPEVEFMSSDQLADLILEY